MKVLICTMGKDGGAVYNACRIHKYDKLVLIMEKDGIGGLEHENIKAFEKSNPNRLITIPVNPLDLIFCYEAVDKVLVNHYRDEVILNISGGTKLLSMASILCAFNHGIPAYHYEDRSLTRLPVFRNFSIKEKISLGPQAQVLKTVKHGITMKTLEKRVELTGIPLERLRKELLALKNKDIIKIKIEKGKEKGTTKVYLTEHGKRYREYFQNVAKREKRR